MLQLANSTRTEQTRLAFHLLLLKPENFSKTVSPKLNMDLVVEIQIFASPNLVSVEVRSSKFEV